MKVTILYTQNTPADREIEYLMKRLASVRILADLVDADSKEGVAVAELYDVMARPAVVVTDSAGRLVQKWQSELPRAEDVGAAYQVST